MYIQPLSDKDKLDVNQVRPLIPPKNSPPHVRSWPNRMIRLFLPIISNLAIAYLALVEQHHMSLTELKRRMKNEYFSYRELFALSEMLSHQTHLRRTGHVLKQETLRQIIARSPTIRRQDVIDMILLYCHSQIQRDWRIKEAVLDTRLDSPELRREIDECLESYA